MQRRKKSEQNSKLGKISNTCLQRQDIPQAKELQARASDQRVLLAFQAELGALQKSSLFLPAAEARPFLCCH